MRAREWGVVRVEGNHPAFPAGPWRSGRWTSAVKEKTASAVEAAAVLLVPERQTIGYCNEAKTRGRFPGYFFSLVISAALELPNCMSGLLNFTSLW